MEKECAKSKLKTFNLKIQDALIVCDLQSCNCSQKISACCLDDNKYTCNECISDHENCKNLMPFKPTKLIPHYLKTTIEIYFLLVEFMKHSNDPYLFEPLIHKIEAIVRSAKNNRNNNIEDESNHFQLKVQDRINQTMWNIRLRKHEILTSLKYLKTHKDTEVQLSVIKNQEFNKTNIIEKLAQLK